MAKKKDEAKKKKLHGNNFYFLGCLWGVFFSQIKLKLDKFNLTISILHNCSSLLNTKYEIFNENMLLWKYLYEINYIQLLYTLNLKYGI